MAQRSIAQTPIIPRANFDYDVIVIGSGAGGSPAASILARAGKRVAIVEKSTFGGESPNWGDIPTGALLHVANVYQTAHQAAGFGLRTADLSYNYPSLLAWKNTTIARTGAGDNRDYYEKQGITVLTGNAHFLSPHEIAIDQQRVSAPKFLIATGSTWHIPHIPGLDGNSYFVPKTLLAQPRPPRSLFIIGSHATAIELAQLFAIFGTKVYVAEAARRILPEFESEVSDTMISDMRHRYGITVLTQARITGVEQAGHDRRIRYIQGHQEHVVKAEALLIADGRIPVTDLGLENAGVEYDRYGISVNAAMQTSIRHIFAVGNVVDTTAQTHSILSHSRTAAHNMLHHAMIALDDQPKLQVVFTQPQIAQTGFNEDDCIKRDLRVKTAIAPLTLTARSNITDQRIGFVKLISDKKGVLLGATIVAPQASDMIAQLTLAVRQGMTAEALVNTPNCFVAWSEAVRIAAGKLL